MAVARDYYVGKTHIIIMDDSCVKTQEEVNEILRRCGQIATREYERMAMEEAAGQPE